MSGSLEKSTQVLLKKSICLYDCEKSNITDLTEKLEEYNKLLIKCLIQDCGRTFPLKDIE